MLGLYRTYVRLVRIAMLLLVIACSVLVRKMMMMVVTKKILAREMKEGLSSGLWEPDEIELDVSSIQLHPAPSSSIDVSSLADY